MCIWHFSRIPSAKLEDLPFVFSIIPKADENGNFLLFFYFRIHGGKVCETAKRFNSMKAFMLRKRGYHSRFMITPQEKFPCCFSESFKHSSSFSYYVLSWYKFHCNTGSFLIFLFWRVFLIPKIKIIVPSVLFIQRTSMNKYPSIMDFATHVIIVKQVIG